MYVYHLIDVFTGDRIETLTPRATPSWARRPEPVAWPVTFTVRPDPRQVRGEMVEGNPMAGLQHRVRPWRDAVVVSWLTEAGAEIALAVGIVKKMTLDETAGTMTVDTVCLRTLMDDRLLLTKTAFPPKGRLVNVLGYSAVGVASELVRIATRNYEAIPLPELPEVGGFPLPVDRPTATAGSYNYQWWGYNFKTVGEALDDLEEEAGIVVDFRPRWVSGFNLRWSLEVFDDAERADEVLLLGSTGARFPQAVYTGTTVDHSGLATVTHHTGHGSEVDILYTRESDTTPTVVARERLHARPDIEDVQQLLRQARATYRESRKVLVQDAVTMLIGRAEAGPGWLTPANLRLGATVQVTLHDSLHYGHTTLRRTLIGWKASGDNAIELELQDLAEDSGV